MTSYSLIIDNTQQVNDIKSLKDEVDTVYLKQEIKIIYLVSDKWFVLTITFSSLNFIIILLLIMLFFLYRKKKQDHRNFLKHKQKKLMGEYKKYEMTSEYDNYENSLDVGGLLIQPRKSQ